jgi:hypothetical protein
LRILSKEISSRIRALALVATAAVAIGLVGCGYASSPANQTSTGQSPTGGPATGVLTPSVASINFPSVIVGSTSTQSLVVTNTGTASVQITSASISGSVFTVVSGSPSVTLPVGQSATWQIQFAPTAAGNVTGSVTMGSTASQSPLVVGLSGTGVSTQAQLGINPSSVAFGNVADGTTDSQQVTLQNTGNATLTFSGINVSGAGFGQNGLTTSTTIAAGATATFTATFAPASPGAASGAIALVTNGSPSSFSIPLSGTGQAASAVLGASATNLAFGGVLDAGSSSLTTSLTNNGNSNITISGVTVTGAAFSASGIPNGTTLTPGQSATLTVTFAPTSGGPVTGANVSIASNAASSPLTIGLTGTGMHSVVVLWSPSTTSGVAYNVFRGTASGSEATTPINLSPVSGLSYTDTTVTPGSDYFYYVEAVNSGGSSAPSSEVSADVPNP